MTWYVWYQNNSGSKTSIGDKLGVFVAIEETNEDTVDQKAKELGIYYRGTARGIDCPCCGDRWVRPEEIEFPFTDGVVRFDDIEEYMTSLAAGHLFRIRGVMARAYALSGDVLEFSKDEEGVVTCQKH